MKTHTLRKHTDCPQCHARQSELIKALETIERALGHHSYWRPSMVDYLQKIALDAIANAKMVEEHDWARTA